MHSQPEQKYRSGVRFCARLFIFETPTRTSRHVTLNPAGSFAIRASTRLLETSFASFKTELSSTPHAPGSHSLPAIPSKELLPPSQKPELRDGDRDDLCQVRGNEIHPPALHNHHLPRYGLPAAPITPG